MSQPGCSSSGWWLGGLGSAVAGGGGGFFCFLGSLPLSRLFSGVVRTPTAAFGVPPRRWERGLGVVRPALSDRGSDSAFQMADTSRRILARGSTSTPECEAAGCFLSRPPPPLSSCVLPPLCLSVLRPQIPKGSLHRGANPLLSAPLALLSSESYENHRL